ncbi:unnamed protein product, partial [Mesorhabditis spiculigera]
MLRAWGYPATGLRFVSQGSRPLIKKIDKVLIANRGEIAIRVMNTARKMGIETVAVFSDADRGALFVRKADKAYHIGPAQATQSYLNVDKVIDTALKAGAQGIHPGYGFLSENAGFADKCAEAGLVFIGPPSQAIRDMGTKSLAKQIMQDAKVPVVEGFHGADQSDANLKKHAQAIGYPVMLKAVYGGGGKGMRIAWKESDFDEAVTSARNEAMKSFGNDEMLVEKFVERPRHVEVQVFGDHHNNYVYLWERDCSVQRRHQKIIEEAPAPNISMETRRRLGESAVRAASAVGYVGAGTVEFIMDPRGDFYFMEMNTRLQVEHPVSEAITGTDLVEWQLKVAQGEELPLKQADVRLNGHAMECRVYAEDTRKGAFMPTAGKLDYVEFPEDARVDTGVVSGDEVSVHYDPMIAKVIVWGRDRVEASAKLDKALKATRIAGLPTNIDFVRTVLKHPEFIKGNVYTDFIPDFQEELFADKATTMEEIVETVIGRQIAERPLGAPKSVFQALPDFRLNLNMRKTFQVGAKTVELEVTGENKYKIHIDGEAVESSVSNLREEGNKRSFTIEAAGRRWRVETVQTQENILVYGVGENEFQKPMNPLLAAAGAGATQGDAISPMPGIVEKVLVKPGDNVKQGQSLVTMVAMKMEYIIKASKDAVVESVNCAPGKNVAKNTVLVHFKE